jgi:hypothetical protein
MSVAPPPSPAAIAQETRRARLAVAAATVGIAAMLFAYAIAPGVRHAVSHAAHSVQHTFSHAVTRVFDRGPQAEAVSSTGHRQPRTHARPPKAPAARKGKSPGIGVNAP